MRVVLFAVLLAGSASAEVLHVCADTSGVSCPETEKIVPNPFSVTGFTYSDVVPDTVDLARWAADFVHASLQVQLPSATINARWMAGMPGVWVPDNAYGYTTMVAFQSIVRSDGWKPCDGSIVACIDNAGTAQWAIGLQAILRAHKMSGDPTDPDDIDRELKSMRAVFAQNQNGSQTDPGVDHGTWGYSLMFLNDLYRAFPDNTSVRDAMSEYIRYENALLNTDGQYYWWYNIVQPPSAYNTHSGQVHQQALMNEPLALWYSFTRDPLALDLSKKTADYLQHYQGGALWQNPDPVHDFADAPVFFNGHTLAYTTGMLAVLNDARARYEADPMDPNVPVEIAFARDGYEFFKRRANMGTLGNFGVSSSLGVMMQLAVQLEHFRFTFPSIVPLSIYYEDLERWVRNPAAEVRVDATVASFGGNTADANACFDRVATRGTGVFLSDDTHPFAIPLYDFLDNNDGLWLMRGLYEVWKSTVEIDGTVAWVNMLLNNASRYMDVYSDLPYRGLLRVQLRQDIGPLTELAIRVPPWTDQSQVTILEGTAAGATPLAQNDRWSWNGAYVVIWGLKAGATYQVQFPMKVMQRTVDQIRPQNAHWSEEDYGPEVLPGRPGVTTFNVTFLGDTVVNVSEAATGTDPRTTAYQGLPSIPRYQRQTLAALVSGTSAIETAPPQITVPRFVYTGVASSLKTDKMVYAPGEAIAATWVVNEESETTERDVIAIESSGAQTKGARSGQVMLTAPAAPGSHRVVYQADGMTELMHADFTVAGANADGGAPPVDAPDADVPDGNVPHADGGPDSTHTMIGSRCGCQAGGLEAYILAAWALLRRRRVK
jgi:hypothetical protein